MPEAARDSIFVSTEWLSARMDAPDLVVVDGSYYLSSMNRDAGAEYLAGHIPGAVRFDIDTVKDTSSPLPHMMPDAARFAEAVGAMGIGDGMTIIVYDGIGLFSAPRVRWMFRAFGARHVMILDGGFPTWQAEGRAIATGPEPMRRAARFTARFDGTSVADLSDIRAALATGSAQVVDARPANRFRPYARLAQPALHRDHQRWQDEGCRQHCGNLRRRRCGPSPPRGDKLRLRRVRCHSLHSARADRPASQVSL